MDKWHKIFTLIFVIGAIALIINILFDIGVLSSVPENCNPRDYESGSREWRECMSKRVAKIKGVETIEDCQDVEGAGAKESCYKNIAIKQRDISICNKIREIEQDEYTKRFKLGYSLDERIGLCISSVAIEINDPEGCKKLFEPTNVSELLPDLKDSCYLNIAENTVNLQLCENIDRAFAKNLCKKQVNEKIMRFAIETSNPQLCENISENSRLKNNCIEAMDIQTKRL